LKIRLSPKNTAAAIPQNQRTYTRGRTVDLVCPVIFGAYQGVSLVSGAVPACGV